ncbi:ABC-type multidrug transport system%2C ATPase and permease component subunits%2C putative [Staphylococcus aureus]|uniref:ABC transporter ATP-binding protein n=1 Tax=Staphylococcus aureus TaxID=1280 RepID=UPI0007CA5980|nr:ABC transporter ATP-binding protein [Staphylococcus aureus]MCB8158301.1 ABC transporter ATP-binding protein [Staphylococcus aureus]SBB01637.1 ABC-type multidrug transport system%2C ATPase and permease component subunits%2C putative [Staphylococcus aureus]SBB92096.1 ABC-type multidrug transport system%2C ATPase and permease component subunits%2C putative [Staphylococcus aureus]HBC4299867.1 ABC transporter ATP-binding protein [Staphylococcus aureus]HDC7468326.1 ABC transporter ATP-binding pro
MFRITFKILNWVSPYKTRMILGFIMSFLNAIFIALPIFLASQIFNNVVSHKSIYGKDIFNVVIIMIILVLGRFITAYLKSKNQESIAYEMSANERLNIGNKLKNVPLGYFNTHHSNELTTIVTTDLTFLENFAMKMVDIVINGYILISVLILSLLVVSWQVALLACIGVLLSFLTIQLLENKSKKNAPTYHYAQNQLIEKVVEVIRGIQVIKSFSKENASLRSFNRAVNESKRVNTKIEMQYIPFNLLHLLSLKVTSILIVLVACLLFIHNSIDLPTFIMISIFSFVIFDSVENINSAAHVLEIIDMTLEDIEKIKSAPELDKKGKDLTIENDDIAFENVNFSYDDKQVIKNVSFDIAANTSTAIVGPSGSGKSTLCHLLLRFYDVNDGFIRIGGIDIKDLKLSSLMSQISAVFQKVYLFNDTIENNILFGNPDATEEEVIRAAKQACCYDFIMKLPDGYKTVLHEKGNNLSGGERQRISIARAILKDAPIIILDEATASIDPENEQLIQTAINELSKGKTVITIAHKLETIKNADQIIVLNEGEIIQKGSHDELIRKPGMYQDFIRIKSKSAGWKL